MLSNMITFATWRGTEGAAAVVEDEAAAAGLSTTKLHAVEYAYDLR